MSEFHRLTIAEIERLCDDAVAVTFAVPAALHAEFDFRPGQYLTLRQFAPEPGTDTPADSPASPADSPASPADSPASPADSPASKPASPADVVEQRRSYSICAPAGASPRVGVRRIEGGLFSEWLTEGAKVGDQVEVAGPAGSFTPELVAGQHHGLIAAGSGITPVLSIAASVLAAHPDTRVTLVYGNRRTDTVMFAEELADLKNGYGPRLHLLHVLSREPMEAEIFSGRLEPAKLHELLTKLVDVPGVDQWWLCGPLGMTDGALAVLTELGVPRGRVHRELFYVDEPPPELRRPDEPAGVAGRTSEVTVVLGGRSTVLTLPRDVPVLDAAQRVRSDLPFACKGGVCGTCRARVTGGQARMRRNYALEEEELAAGFVLTCQTLPVSDTLTIDYDT